jgi:chaperonin cofactor prefoldin
MSKIEKTIQDMKEEINKDMEILKTNQSKINNSISQVSNYLNQKLGKQSGTS